MNYKPFSQIARGDVVALADLPEVFLMKTDVNEAILLTGYWTSSGILRSRGDTVNVPTTTCVIIPEATEMTISMVKVDPVDPRRRFWKEGDQAQVGRESTAKINVFAGLFLYSGWGSGNYNSSVDNEILWLTTTEASALARKENIPTVHYDSFDWTSDPTLAHQRAYAQRRFDEAAAARQQNEAVA